MRNGPHRREFDCLISSLLSLISSLHLLSSPCLPHTENRNEPQENLCWWRRTRIIIALYSLNSCFRSFPLSSIHTQKIETNHKKRIWLCWWEKCDHAGHVLGKVQEGNLKSYLFKKYSREEEKNIVQMGLKDLNTRGRGYRGGAEVICTCYCHQHTQDAKDAWRAARALLLRARWGTSWWMERETEVEWRRDGRRKGEMNGQPTNTPYTQF